MSNKTSDNVATEEDIKVLKNIERLRRIEFKHCVTDREMKAIEHLLAEREQKDKRIKEVEEENLIQRKQIMNIFDNDYIPTQAVIDKINEYDKKMEEDAGHPNWVITDRIVMNVLQELLEGGSK